MYAQRPFEKN